MTKKEIEQKVKEILSKDDRFKGTVIKINFRDKKKGKVL